MARKKNDIDIEALLENAEEAPVEVEAPKEEIEEDELVVAPVEEEPLQTFANEPAQPFDFPKEDAPKGIGGSYFIDATGKRVKRLN